MGLEKAESEIEQDRPRIIVTVLLLQRSHRHFQQSFSSLTEIAGLRVKNTKPIAGLILNRRADATSQPYLNVGPAVLKFMNDRPLPAPRAKDQLEEAGKDSRYHEAQHYITEYTEVFRLVDLTLDQEQSCPLECSGYKDAGEMLYDERTMRISCETL